jgi:hypothetical protein
MSFTGIDGATVSVSVTKVAFTKTVPFFVTAIVQVAPEHALNGQSCEPHGICAREDDLDGSKAFPHGVPAAHGLHWRNVAPVVAVSNPTVRFWTGVP